MQVFMPNVYGLLNIENVVDINQSINEVAHHADRLQHRGIQT